MIWALYANDRIKASPKITGALCPSCKESVISKCGSLKEWHWAHKANNDCDSWSEGETEWHINWKNHFPKEQQEVVMSPHRADIKNSQGVVIELQNSPISPEDIGKRETFYQNMIWLINGQSFAKNLILKKKEDYFSFRWKHPPKSWWNANKNIYIDLSFLPNHIGKSIESDLKFYGSLSRSYLEERNLLRKLLISKPIFLIKKVYNNIPCGGWGILLSKGEFLKQYGGIVHAARS